MSVMFEQITTHYKLILVLLSVLTVAALFYRWYYKNCFSLKTRKLVKKISYDYLENATLDSGLDQYAQFDYILLTDKGILVVEVKNYSGHIFGANKIDEWTQIINRKSYKFANPFFEMSHKIELLRDISHEVHVNGLILFTDEADFPKGCPESVIKLAYLKDHYRKLTKQAVPTGMQKTWDLIKRQVQQA